MTSLIRTVTFDCGDPLKLCRFWSDLTGWPVHEESDEDEAMVVAPEPRPNLLFVRVPEGKQAKNRLHFDITPTDRTRDEEVQRLAELGATVTEDLRNPDGTGWAVMTDLEGNEFCVERSAAERTG